MTENNDLMLFLAQGNDNLISEATDGTTVAETGNNSGSTAAPEGGLMGMMKGNPMMWLIFLVPVVMLLMGGGNRKKQKQAKEQLKSLEKGDKVQSIGGIIGTVFHVKEDSIVVKVDGTTKMEFASSAVSTVLEKKNQPQGAAAPAASGGIFASIKERIGGGKKKEIVDNGPVIDKKNDSNDSADAESDEK